MNRLFLLLGLAGLLLAAGCRKDDLVDCAPASSNLSLQEFARRNGAPVQTFSLALGSTAQVVQTFTTSGGTMISFPSVGFLLPNGTAATGPAQVRVREIYSVADMILSNMPTQVLGTRQLLISGGEFSIQVWQNGTRLRLAANAPRVVIDSPIPTGVASGQQLLWQQLAATVPDSAAWSRPASLDTVRTIRNINNPTSPSTFDYVASVPLDSISWWNIDQLWSLYQTTPVGPITVQVPVIPAGSSGATQIFLRAVGLNGLARLYPTNAARTNWSASVPTGASMKVVVLQSIGGQLYFGTQSITTQSGLVVTPTLTAVSEADAVRLIRQL
jgi:outer membrane protein assembly factor BamB